MYSIMLYFLGGYLYYNISPQAGQQCRFFLGFFNFYKLSERIERVHTSHERNILRLCIQTVFKFL